MFERTLWALIATMALLFGSLASGSEATKPGSESRETNRENQPAPKLVSAAQPSPNEDAAAENALLKLANQSRQQAGIPGLHLDAGLTEAAREHARLMVESGTLSHQFAGEQPLLRRIAQETSAPLDRVRENVAYNGTPEGAHDALMHSPPHRENLLDPRFNTAGFAAIWSNGRLYIVEDFAHEAPAFSAQQTREVVARALGEVRSRAGLGALTLVASPGLDSAVCTLNHEAQLSARRLNISYPTREAIAYSQSRPESLPAAAVHAIRDGSVRQFAVGACYTRDAQYPSGIYKVVILLY